MPDTVHQNRHAAASAIKSDTETELVSRKEPSSSDEHVSPVAATGRDTEATVEENVEGTPKKYHQWVTDLPSKPKPKKKGGKKGKAKDGDDSQKGGQTKKIIFPRATLATFFPRHSWFSEEEQRQYLELHRKYMACLPPKPTPQQVKEIHMFRVRTQL